MAEIINSTYGKGDNGAIKLAADLQTLWEFTKIETATTEYGVSVNLWVNDYTYLQISDTPQSSPKIAMYHKNMLVESISGRTDGSGALYAAKTNNAAILTYQAKDTTNVTAHGSGIMIGKAENPQTGAEETVAAIRKWSLSSGYDKYADYICASDTSSTAITPPDAITHYNSISRLTVLRPFTMDESSFVMKNVYRLITQQTTPFIGNCTLNGRKFFAIGTIFAEDN